MDISTQNQDDKLSHSSQTDPNNLSDNGPMHADTESALKNNDKMDIETKDEKIAKKRSSASAKNKQKQRNQRFKIHSLTVFEEKPKLSREELKTLQAMKLFEKMEQKAKHKEEHSRKKVKLNQDEVPNQFATEKSATPEIEHSGDSKSTMMSSPNKEQMVEESTTVVERIGSQKKVDNRSLSKFLNPKIDLQNYSNLSSFIQSYQSQQLELQAKGSFLPSEPQISSKKPNASSSACKGIISDVKEQYFSDQQFNLKSVTGKFAEYLEQQKREGNLKSTLELIKGFKH